MNKLLTSSIIAMLVLPVAVMAQEANAESRAAVAKVLNQHAVGVQTGTIKVDSMAVTADSVKFFASRNLTYLPIRHDNLAQIMADIKKVLPTDCAQKTIAIMADKKDVSTLIPRDMQNGKNQPLQILPPHRWCATSTAPTHRRMASMASTLPCGRATDCIISRAWLAGSGSADVCSRA